MRTTFITTLLELAQKNSNLMLITGDLGFGVFEEFQNKFPNQFLNAGVAEQNMMGLATGLALDGWIVFTYSIGNFPTLRCLEQLRNGACYHEANVNIVSIGGGFSYGQLGFSHHATEDLSIVRSLPNTTVVAPGNLWEVEQATRSLFSKKGVGYLRLDKSCAPDQQSPPPFELGKARVLKQGSDVLLISTGGILQEVLLAATQIEEKGFSVGILHYPTLKPFDAKTLANEINPNQVVLTIEEHSVLGGLGGSVAEACLEENIRPKRFYRIGLRDCFSTIVGTQEYLRSHYQMDHTSIASKAFELLNL